MHQNQFGGLVAGPLNLPHYKGHDRTFFMISEESYRLTWGENASGIVPTAAQQAGNFAGDVNNAGKPITLKNPFSNYAFSETALGKRGPCGATRHRLKSVVRVDGDRQSLSIWAPQWYKLKRPTHCSRSGVPDV